MLCRWRLLVDWGLNEIIQEGDGELSVALL